MNSKPSTISANVLAAAATAATQAAAAAEMACQAVLAVQAQMGGGAAPKEPAGGLPFAEVALGSTPREARRRRPARIRWGRVQFNCPACHRFTVVALAHSGQRVSCPKCFTGIRVPDPRQRIPAENLGRTMDPILRPDAFSRCVDAHRLLPWLIGRLPGPAQVVAALGIILLIAGTSALAPVTWSWALQPRTVSTPAVTVSPTAGRDLAKEAEQAVQSFLTAKTPAEKAALVIDPTKTLPLMKQWYARKPGSGYEPEATLGASSQGYYSTPGSAVTVSEVPVTLPGGTSRSYVVEHRAEGALIAWAESVGYSPLTWNEIVNQKPVRKDPVPMRLLACRDNYWNFNFNDEGRHSCVRLHDPETMEELGWAYLPRTPGAFDSVKGFLPESPEGLLYPVTVTILPHSHSVKTRQVTMTSPLQPGWGTALPAPSLGMALVQNDTGDHGS